MERVIKASASTLGRKTSNFASDTKKTEGRKGGLTIRQKDTSEEGRGDLQWRGRNRRQQVEVDRGTVGEFVHV